MRGLILLGLTACLVLPRPAFAEEPPLPPGLDEVPALSGKETQKDEEPPLPLGLEPESQPPLPSGLEPSSLKPSPEAPGSGEVPLPPGLEGPGRPAPPEETAGEPGPPSFFKTWLDKVPFDISGFAEGRGGVRTRNDPTQKDLSIGEGRWELQLDKDWEKISLRLTSDFLFDAVPDDHSIDLEMGTGWIDLREASILYRASSFSDIKIGRQILTWGTGDFIFINDLFPKDWNSFLIGRNDEYLKAPSDAFKFSLFFSWVNMDVVYTPRFDNDRFIDGRRLSYFNINVGRIVGRNFPVNVARRKNWFDDDEVSMRVFRNIGRFEAAFYGYWGYWKSPGGFDATRGLFTFPELNVYGASVRGPVGSGILNIETGYYDSGDDRKGNNPLIRNSEFRILVGYERELLPEFTGSVQYYLERMIDHAAYLKTLPSGFPAFKENRHVLTLRLTRLMMNQNLTLTLFNFYSPSDEDGYLRPKINYKFTDDWQGEIGANFFYGLRDHTFFGQFKDNSNVYVALRFGYSFPF